MFICLLHIYVRTYTYMHMQVSVTDRTRNVDVALSNADFDIVGPMSISINGRYGQPVQGDDFLYRITLSLSSTDQNVMFSGRFRLGEQSLRTCVAVSGMYVTYRVSSSSRVWST